MASKFARLAGPELWAPGETVDIGSPSRTGEGSALLSLFAETDPLVLPRKRVGAAGVSIGRNTRETRRG
jgi:hypothetical protein